ncbi:MAG: ABC transporter ATP-binding protein [Comamonadaceae bacterium]|nr:MAG: ABC transporter ATP-binding protein [Comamonadaceae bacterium]
MTASLQVRGLSKTFGGLTAVSNVTFDVRGGEILGLIGPNGAGKTTTFNCIAGALPPSRGTVTLNGVPMQGQVPSVVCRAGLARTFQIVRPFRGMSVRENVAVGAFARTAKVAQAHRIADEVLRQLGAEAIADLEPESLGVAALRKLEVARALATQPSVLLLDEMLAGLTATETEEMCKRVLEMRERGLAIVMVEHSVPVMRRVCDRAVVLNFGAMIAEGPVGDVLENPAVQEAWLGGTVNG